LWFERAHRRNNETQLFQTFPLYQYQSRVSQRIYTVSSAGAGHAYLNKLSDDQSWRYEKIEILSFPNLAITLVLLTTQSQNVIRRK